MNFGKIRNMIFRKWGGRGQRLFGTFPKIHPFLKGQASLIIFSRQQSNIIEPNLLSTYMMMMTFVILLLRLAWIVPKFLFWAFQFWWQSSHVWLERICGHLTPNWLCNLVCSFFPMGWNYSVVGLLSSSNEMHHERKIERRYWAKFGGRVSYKLWTIKLCFSLKSLKKLF